MLWRCRRVLWHTAGASRLQDGHLMVSEYAPDFDKIGEVGAQVRAGFCMFACSHSTCCALLFACVSLLLVGSVTARAHTHMRVCARACNLSACCVAGAPAELAWRRSGVHRVADACAGRALEASWRAQDAVQGAPDAHAERGERQEDGCRRGRVWQWRRRRFGSGASCGR